MEPTSQLACYNKGWIVDRHLGHSLSVLLRKFVIIIVKNWKFSFNMKYTEGWNLFVWLLLFILNSVMCQECSKYHLKYIHCSVKFTMSLEKSPVELNSPHFWRIIVYCHSKASSVLEKSWVIAFSMSTLY